MKRTVETDMTIEIEALTLSAIIGILDFERVTPQTVVVDLSLEYAYQEHQFINYADIVQQIETLIKKECYLLLEEALKDIQERLLLTYPKIKKLHLKISKPDIIENARVSLSLNWSL